MIAVVAAIGGGTVRDILLNRYPIFWLVDTNYLILCIVLALLTQIFYRAIEKLNHPLRFFDAIGLASFSLLGFSHAYAQHLSAIIVILMGIITAVVGGIVRDMICAEQPMVLKKDVYISLTILGGLLYLLLKHFDINGLWCDFPVMLFIFIARIVVIYRQWNLPDLSKWL